MNPYKNLVELIPVEECLYNLSLGGDSYVDSIGITKSTNNVKLEDDTIKQALFYLYKRHPLFKANIHIDTITRKTYFAIPNQEKSKDEMNFERYKVESREEFISHMEKTNTKPLDYENKCLLWRFKLYEFKQDDDFMLAFVLILPMYMTDGINIVVLCMELFNIVNSLIQNQTCKEMIEELQLLDNIVKLAQKENLAPIYESGANEPLVSYLLPNKFKDLNSCLKICLLTFDTATTNKLLIKAKKNNIKLTGLLATLVFYALKDLYEENNILMPKDVSFGLPASMRFRFKPKVNSSHARICVGFFDVSLLYPDFGKYENIVDDARHVDFLITKKVSNFEMMKTYEGNELNELNTSYRKNKIDLNEFIEAIDSDKVSDIGLSNIGTYASNDKSIVDGPFKIEELYFGDALKSKQGIYHPFVIYAQTFNNRLMIRVSSQKSRLITQQFMNIFKKKLKEFSLE